MLDLAITLAVKLPGTRAAFRSGILRQSKVEIIAHGSPTSPPKRPAPLRRWSWTGPGG